MRHPILIALALTAASAALPGPAAAQHPGPTPVPAKPSPAAHKPTPARAAPPAKPALAAKPTEAPPLNLDAIAKRASLDPATRARVAPHVAGMNQELVQLRTQTATVRVDAAQADKDRVHQDLNRHFAAFQQHWKEADALLTAAQRPGFDAAVREQMGVRRRVGNPHAKLPPTHPKLNTQGGKAK